MFSLANNRDIKSRLDIVKSPQDIFACFADGVADEDYQTLVALFCGESHPPLGRTVCELLYDTFKKTCYKNLKYEVDWHCGRRSNDLAVNDRWILIGEDMR